MTPETSPSNRRPAGATAHTRRVLSLTILIGILLPLLGTPLLIWFFHGWQGASIPIHSTVEVMGAVFGMILAMVLLFSRHTPCTSRRLFIVCALLSMGVLDIFHSCVKEGETFVWLHSIAVWVGGIFFACVWFPDREISRRRTTATAAGVFLGTVFIGVLSFLHAEWIPTMVVDGKFTAVASAINLTGGGLTLLGGAAFALFYYRGQSLEDLVFLFLCVLFGSSGILFHYAQIWDAGWWFWHLIRLGGYLLPLWLAVFAYRLAEDDTTKQQVRMATALANGDYTVNIIPRHDQDILGIALQSMTQALRTNQELRRQQDWLNTASADLEAVMRGEKELAPLCTDIITCLARQLELPIGTLSLADHEHSLLILTGSFAFTRKPGSDHSFRFGEGLIGQAAKEKKRIVVHEVPEDYLTLTSTLVESPPAQLLCSPFLYEGEVAGVIELGSLLPFTDLQLLFLDQTAEKIAIAIHAAQSREKIQLLLKESQMQAEELKRQQEELRVSHEELEKKDIRLPSQQAHQAASRESGI